jgi:hypothetical protein
VDQLSGATPLLRNTVARGFLCWLPQRRTFFDISFRYSGRRRTRTGRRKYWRCRLPSTRLAAGMAEIRQPCPKPGLRGTRKVSMCAVLRRNPESHGAERKTGQLRPVRGSVAPGHPRIAEAGARSGVFCTTIRGAETSTSSASVAPVDLARAGRKASGRWAASCPSVAWCVPSRRPANETRFSTVCVADAVRSGDEAA